MKTVSMLLESKGNDVWSVSPGATVYDALVRMAEKNVGALLVLEGSRLVGIFSERDYARKVILHGKSSRQTTVGEIMTSRGVYFRTRRTMGASMDLTHDRRR